MTVLSVENGSFAYKKEPKLFTNISFKAESGDIVAILGPNGAGKTTLLRCLMGFLDWTDGQSCLNGKDIRSIPQKQLWRYVSYVPQAKHTVSSYSVEEMILLGRSSSFGIFDHPCDDDVKKTHEVMDKLNIAKLSGKKCSELSGGELQMVLMARALVSEPKVLILDEPESNLDFKNQLLVLEAMSQFASDGMSCIFNTHYPAHALQRANKALLLDGRGNCLFGDANSVITEENIEQAFGVQAVINEIETRGNIMQNVVPLRVARTQSSGQLKSEAMKGRVLAVIAVIACDYNIAEQINLILHKYSPYIIGRMGMPYRDGGVYIINITLDAPEIEVISLAQNLKRLPNISVKTTFAPIIYDTKEKGEII